MTMVKKYYNFRYALKIDGEPFPAERVSLHFQLNPFPGGHKYSCVVSGNHLAKYFDYIPPGRSENIPEGLARRFFLSLIINLHPANEERDFRFEYFLNSVEEIDFNGERIKFSGICSAVSRS